MAHAQKTDFVFPRNGRGHLNRWGASVQSTAGSRSVRISLSNAGFTTFGGGLRVLATHSIRQFPLYFPSRASSCATRFRTSSTSVFSWGKGGRCLRLRPTTLVVANVKKIRGLNLPGTLWATSTCCGGPLPLPLLPKDNWN